MKRMNIVLMSVTFLLAVICGAEDAQLPCPRCGGKGMVVTVVSVQRPVQVPTGRKIVRQSSSNADADNSFNRFAQPTQTYTVDEYRWEQRVFQEEQREFCSCETGKRLAAEADREAAKAASRKEAERQQEIAEALKQYREIHAELTRANARVRAIEERIRAAKAILPKDPTPARSATKAQQEAWNEYVAASKEESSAKATAGTVERKLQAVGERLHDLGVSEHEIQQHIQAFAQQTSDKKDQPGAFSIHLKDGKTIQAASLTRKLGSDRSTGRDASGGPVALKNEDIDKIESANMLPVRKLIRLKDGSTIKATSYTCAFTNPTPTDPCWMVTDQGVRIDMVFGDLDRVEDVQQDDK